MTGGLDGRVVAAAEETVAGAIAAFVGGVGQERATVVTAPAGAGKSGLVCQAVGAARRAKLRVAVATPTNEQAYQLVDRLARQHPRETITFVPARDRVLPDDTAGLANVVTATAQEANEARVIVGTLAKLGESFAREQLLAVDALLIDESYQADASRYFAIADLARTHLLVGDGGQISPFSTLRDADHWRGLPEDPLQTAVGVLLRNHPTIRPIALPITRRLDSRAVPIARSFYPSFRFEAAALPGARRFQLEAAAGGRRLAAHDRALELAARSGWAYLEQPAAPSLSAAPDTVELIVSLLTRLFARRPRVSCERFTRLANVALDRVAVGVSHNDQKDALRHALQQADLAAVVVDTANKLQGLEFDLVIAWHPLAGLAEADEFHVDPGRLCVLLTRHRHACIVIGRSGDPELLDGVPPPTPAYIGWDADPVLDGWHAHQEVYSALAPFTVPVS